MLQRNLPEVLEKESTKKDFFKLPIECLTKIFSSNETLIAEIKLFRVLEEQILLKKGNRKLSDNSNDSSVNSADLSHSS